MIEAHVLDMDGVLVDSEILWRKVRQEFALSRGQTLKSSSLVWWKVSWPPPEPNYIWGQGDLSAFHNSEVSVLRCGRLPQDGEVHAKGILHGAGRPFAHGRFVLL